MANDETTGLLTAAERETVDACLCGYRMHSFDHDTLGALLRRFGAGDEPVNQYVLRALLWADDRARALIAAAEARGVEKERERCARLVERLMQHGITGTASVYEGLVRLHDAITQPDAAPRTTPPATGAREGAGDA